MTDVQFDEQVEFTPRVTPPEKITGITALFIKWKWAKNEEHAEILMLAITICAFVAMFALWIFGSPHEPPPAEPVAIHSV